MYGLCSRDHLCSNIYFGFLTCHIFCRPGLGRFLSLVVFNLLLWVGCCGLILDHLFWFLRILQVDTSAGQLLADGLVGSAAVKLLLQTN